MKTQLDRPIVIIGMPGSGKSTVGRKLSKKIDVQFYDSDAVIEGREGLVIEDIHEYMGEKYFSSIEQKTVEEIVNYEPCVLSTGSNTFDNIYLQKIILEKTICVWLDVNINTILDRILRRNTRSILLTEEEISIFKKQYVEKKIHFEKNCHIRIKGDIDITQLLSTLLVKLDKFLCNEKG